MATNSHNFSTKFLAIVLLLFSFIILSYGKKDNYIVATKLGKVQSTLDKSAWTQREYSEFKGIPYAQVPVGSLRFEPPVINKGWEGVRQSNYSAVCPQVDAYDHDIIEGDEDCLYLNVFVPNIRKPNVKLPVLVWIHGGSFQYESGSDYGPKYWMEHDLILVTFNFRIGVLGFYQTADGRVAGNMGLKDQVMALQWVQENIGAFGGDRDRVTIMGVNSGAISVHLHMLSDLSKGLFQQAVSQSGNALVPWAIVNGDKTQKLTKMMRKCNDPNSTDTLGCFKGLEAREIVRVQPGFAEWYIDPIVSMGPTLELPGENAFLSRSPYKIMKEGTWNKVPWLLGVNAEEGLLHSAEIVNSLPLSRILETQWAKAAPITLMLRNLTLEMDKTTEAIKKYYFGEDSIEGNNEIVANLTNMYSDRYFFHGTHRAAKLAAEQSQVYLYLFDYKGAQTLMGLRNSSQNGDYGVGHYDQIQYLFNTPYFQEVSKEEETIAKEILNVFAQFVMSGTPSNGNWVEVNPKENALQYNVVGLNPGAVDEPWKERLEFWDSLSLLEFENEPVKEIKNTNSNKEEL